MKQLIATIALTTLVFNIKAKATNYYFSYSSGDDSRTSAQAQSSSTPWKTIGKLNSIMSILQPGDSVLFKRGDTFFGEILIGKSGSSSSKIVFGAYGSGARPIITGFQTVSPWTSIGNGVYESVFTSGLSTLNMVTRNDVFQPLGRWPKATDANSGYLAYQSHSGVVSITSNAIAAAANYVGGEIVIRANHSNIDRGKIISQSSTTVTYTMLSGGNINSPLDGGYGFFFQNHVSTLTTLGEWMYDPSTQKVRMYFGSNSPTSYWVKASAITNNVTITSQSYITFDNLYFTGSNSKTFNITNSNNIQINNCDITFAGINGVSADASSNNITVYNSNFSYINNNAIDANNSTYWTISNSTFTNIGNTAGMGVSGDGQYIVAALIGSNSLIQNNTITNAGFNGIQFTGSPITIQNNFINNFCMVKDAGGAIYTYQNISAGVKTIKNNVIINGIGAPNGTVSFMDGGALGIFADGSSNNVQLLNNSIANCETLGIGIYDGQNAVISGNTVYNCGTPYQGNQDAGGGQIFFNHSSSGQGVRNVTLTNNIFFAQLAIGQATIRASTPSNDLNLFFGTADNNYYARPMSDNTSIFDRITSPAWLTLTQWQSAIGKDANSKTSPKTVTSTNSLRYEYNATTANKVVNVGATYIDVKGTSYAGSITLAPFSSAVLIYVSGTPTNDTTTTTTSSGSGSSGSTSGTTGTTSGGTTGTTGGTSSGTGGYSTPNTASGVKYYFSSSTGDDTRTSAQAQNPSTPWKSIAKLNSFFSSLNPGDSVLFKRGDVFGGEIIINKSGTSSSKIVLSTYGSGTRPVITGFTTISSWTSDGGGIYETVLSPQSSVNMVTRNNTFQPMGRWPKATDANSGYLTYQSHSGITSITSNAIAGAASYVGGEVVIRARHYNIDRGLISAQSSTTVTYTMLSGGGINEPFDGGYGFFFQNHVNTLTTLGEWCYESSTKKLKMYFGGNSPSSYSINASIINNNVTISSQSYITFDNLDFTGSNAKAFNITGSGNIQINNCDIMFAGINGIYTNGSCNNIQVNSTTLSYINNNGIDANGATYWTINNNSFSNIATTAGMGLTGDGQYIVAAYIGSNSLVQYNTINNAGYHGFQFTGSPVTIQNNFINNFCLLKDDGGGIYTYSNTSAGVKTIQNNIVINGIGAPNGTTGTQTGGALGIYADGASNNIQILNNSVANCQQLGIDLNDGQNDVVSGNTVFNCGTPYQGGDGGGGQIAITHWSGGQGVRNVTLTNNIFCAELGSGQRTIGVSTPDNDLTLFFGTADNNYYARPMADATSIFVRTTGPAWLTLTQWQTAIGGKDLHSKTSPKTISSTSSLRFEYNASTSSKTVTLGAAYIDIKGTSYPTSITLAPYSSAVLILASATEAKTAANTTEVAGINPVSQSVVVYPNPVADNFTLGVNNTYTGHMNIQILNEAGQLIQSYSFEKDQPNMRVTLPSKTLASGFYFVHVQVGDWSDVKRILKEQ